MNFPPQNTSHSTSPGPAPRSCDDLMERYLHAIGRHLPKSRREDILAELSANLLAEIEDRESDLGRSLTAAEQSDILKAHGRPFLVAARYSPQQYLIGPNAFPYYWLVLRISLTLSAFVYLLGSSIGLAVTGATFAAYIGVMARLPFNLLVTAGWVTLTFVVLEFWATRYPSKSAVHSQWKPESLPRIDPARRTPARVTAELLIHFGGILYLAAIPRYPSLLLGPGAGYFTAGPLRATAQLHAFYWPMMALLCVPVLLKVASLGRTLTPGWRLALRAVKGAVGLLLLVLLLRIHDYFTVVGSLPDQTNYRQAAAIFNNIITLSLRIAVAVCVLSLVWEIGSYILKGRSAGSYPLAPRAQG
ncbi:MAG TPA: hypothetical protein VGD59_04755 [Acidisarcina sp.]